MPLVGSNLEINIGESHSGPERNTRKCWLDPNDLLAQAVHGLRRLFERASGIAVRIVAVIPKPIGPLEGMACLHLQAENT